MNTGNEKMDRRDFLNRAGAVSVSVPFLLNGSLAQGDEPSSENETSKVKLAVVTGGHAYDVVNFRKLFRSLEGIDAYVQHMDDFAGSGREGRKFYDAVLFYIMLMDGPVNKKGQGATGRVKEAMEQLGSTEQGIIILHHALLAYPNFQPWSQMVGIQNREIKSYKHDQELIINVTNPDHPVTKSMHSFKMTDETYVMNEPGDDSDILLTVDHSRSMKAIGWMRRYNRSRVFNLQSGHNNKTWSNPNFKKILRRGILWTVKRI